jgi:hypothetical protein
MRSADRFEALSFGVGFGAAEALTVGMLATLPLALMLVAPAVLPHAMKEALTRVYGGPVSMAGIVFPPVERASALVFHVVSCAVVVHGCRVGRPWIWFAVAFVYKSAIDAIAAWAILPLGVTTTSVELAGLEVAFTALAVASLCALLCLRSPRRSLHTA